jgi:hypothetical protein
VIIAVFYFSASSHFGYTPDDTFIYLRFARNLVQGNGMSFNPGTPSYGFTSPLWLFIISLGANLGVDPFLAAKVIDVVLASLSLLIFYLLAFEVIRDVAVAICATIAFSVSAWFLRWAGTGMETSLSVVLVLAALLFCFRNEYFIAVVMSALLFLVRPEGILMTPVILFDVYTNSVHRKHAVNMSAALALIFVMMIAPWMFYAYKTFGAVMPNTAFAKAGFHPDLSKFLDTGTDIAKTLGSGDGVALLAALVCGLILFARRKSIANLSGQEGTSTLQYLRPLAIGGIWIAGVILFYLIADVNVVSRYLLLIIPVIVILAFHALFNLVQISGMRKYVYVVVFALTALVMIQNQLFSRYVVGPGIAAFEQGMEHCLIPIGKWFHENTPPGTKVVTGDIGAIGYYSDREICDAAGIVSPAARPMLRAGNTADDIIEKKLYQDMCNPDYVIQRSPEPEHLRGDPGLEPLLSRPFAGVSLTENRVLYYTVYRVKH